MTSVFIVGYSGETGKELVRQMARHDVFKNIVLIGRREIKLPVDNDGRFVQKVIDFDNIEAHEDAFKGCTIGFCCLGALREHGVETFIRVDRDYVVNCAKVAKSAGCQHFQLVSAEMANKNSSMLYNKTKGEAEDLLQQVGLPRVTIFRPAFILVKREPERCIECCCACFLWPCKTCCPSCMTVPISYLAAAMINNVNSEHITAVEIIDNGGIHAIGKSV